MIGPLVYVLSTDWCVSGATLQNQVALENDFGDMTFSFLFFPDLDPVMLFLFLFSFFFNKPAQIVSNLSTAM